MASQYDKRHMTVSCVCTVRPFTDVDVGIVAAPWQETLVCGEAQNRIADSMYHNLTRNMTVSCVIYRNNSGFKDEHGFLEGKCVKCVAEKIVASDSCKLCSLRAPILHQVV